MRGFQFEVGETYEEEDAVLCEKGFHACENPIDVFAYYPPNDSRYCEVELDELSDKGDDDSKRCGRKIHIVAEISLNKLIDAGVKFILDGTDRSAKKLFNTGNWSAATNTGNRSAASVEGESSVALATGIGGWAKGALGCAIALCEYDDDGQLIKLHSEMVDGASILPDTWYTLANGQFTVARQSGEPQNEWR